MPRKVPSQFTGRFSIKPRRPSLKSKSVTSPSSSHEVEAGPLSAKESVLSVEEDPLPLVEKLRDEPIPFYKGKRKRNPKSKAEAGVSVNLGDGHGLDRCHQQEEEVQLPPKRRKHQITEKTDLQVEQATTSNDPDQQRRMSSLDTLPSPRRSHQYQEEAKAILRAGWQSIDKIQPDVEETAQRLVERALNVPDDTTMTFMQCTVQAIHKYASEHPRAIDFMLLAFSEAINRFPESFLNQHSHGHGPEATITHLKWLLIDDDSGFDGLLRSDSLGVADTEDCSNLKFQYNQVNMDLSAVLYQIHDWRFQRKRWLIAAAAQSRCFALEILQKRNGEHIESLIDAGLNRRSNQWCKANMIGACILLRGCAKALNAGVPTSGIKLYAWKASLEKFLLQDDDTWDNDFVIKTHAAVSYYFTLLSLFANTLP